MELCEALRHSLAALRQEKDALREEQRQQKALGASLESLVQERLKANERDKYSVFIGETADSRGVRVVFVHLPGGFGQTMLTLLCLQETWRKS